jgi:hypothetical protein
VARAESEVTTYEKLTEHWKWGEDPFKKEANEDISAS